ncbi:MAG TPA: amidohydrolase family protein [Stellaceae bacterium]|jgi:imidazolonepropionase-like amidohydrolase|nr:amidohydrolase family protein [Stellaceae bacterium]
MAATLITNVAIFDGSGAPLFPGEVLVEGNRIKTVARGGERIAAPGATVIDGGGATLTPGLIEAHAHLGFGSAVDRVLKGRGQTAEQMLLITAHTAKVMLDYGFTGAYSAGAHSAPAEVALRDDIAAGWLPGPRLRACSFEREASAIMEGAGRTYTGFEHRPPDVEGVRAFVREMAGIGVDSVKFVVTGDNSIVPNTSHILLYHDEELRAASQTAGEAGVWLNAHAHSAAAIKLLLKNNFRVIYHCTWPDEQALDMLEERKDAIFVAPTVGLNWTNIYADPSYAKRDNGAALREQIAKLDHLRELLPVLHKRGIRLLPGGDYGFPTNPIGKNAHDIELFVTLFGFSPAEALSAATKLGGEIMGMADELGLIQPGYLADLLLVDGDPLRDIALFQDADRLLMIMKDGKFHKSPQPRRYREARAA